MSSASNLSTDKMVGGSGSRNLDKLSFVDVFGCMSRTFENIRMARQGSSFKNIIYYSVLQAIMLSLLFH